ncbi:hypothetical protein TRAPUB_9960 [Trametes pubescens]|uniref:Uncharacterized protein n=1 Tax=Trametes pubescens TaxID=154538 RepID=A0A1M2W0V1_TRAPU|nr:hypothetical protein TRAPUB_9960 [Trametes pubescens]
MFVSAVDGEDGIRQGRARIRSMFSSPGASIRRMCRDVFGAVVGVSAEEVIVEDKQLGQREHRGPRSRFRTVTRM